jgi:hypothetical protein
MKRKQLPAPQQPGIVIYDDEPKFPVRPVAAAVVVASIGLAIAAWQLSTGIKWSLIIIAAGSATSAIIDTTLRGLAYYHYHKLRGLAELERAKAELHRARRGK